MWPFSEHTKRCPDERKLIEIIGVQVCLKLNTSRTTNSSEIFSWCEGCASKFHREFKYYYEECKKNPHHTYEDMIHETDLNLIEIKIN